SPAAFERPPDPAPATAGEDVPVPAGGLGELGDLVPRLALGPAAQVRPGDHAREPPVALPAPSEHQQVLAAGQRELGAELGLATVFGAELSHSPSWSVIASAVSPSSAAASAIASGEEAP